MKMRKILKWINQTVSTVIIILLVSVTLMVFFSKTSDGVPEVFGYQLKTVLSGSMEPDIQTGSVIAIKSAESDERSSFQKGDVITFIEEENMLITHRIAEVITTDSGVLYTTKGDNNNAVDINPVLPENVIGIYVDFTVPYIGYVINFLQSPEGSALLLILPGILIFGYSIISIWKALSNLEKKVGI